MSELFSILKRDKMEVTSRVTCKHISDIVMSTRGIPVVCQSILDLNEAFPWQMFDASVIRVGVSVPTSKYPSPHIAKNERINSSKG